MTSMQLADFHNLETGELTMPTLELLSMQQKDIIKNAMSMKDMSQAIDLMMCDFWDLQESSSPEEQKAFMELNTISTALNTLQTSGLDHAERKQKEKVLNAFFNRFALEEGVNTTDAFEKDYDRCCQTHQVPVVESKNELVIDSLDTDQKCFQAFQKISAIRSNLQQIQAVDKKQSPQDVSSLAENNLFYTEAALECQKTLQSLQNTEFSSDKQYQVAQLIRGEITVIFTLLAKTPILAGKMNQQDKNLFAEIPGIALENTIELSQNNSSDYDYKKLAGVFQTLSSMTNLLQKHQTVLPSTFTTQLAKLLSADELKCVVAVDGTLNQKNLTQVLTAKADAYERLAMPATGWLRQAVRKHGRLMTTITLALGLVAVMSGHVNAQEKKVKQVVGKQGDSQSDTNPTDLGHELGQQQQDTAQQIVDDTTTSGQQYITAFESPRGRRNGSDKRPLTLKQFNNVQNNMNKVLSASATIGNVKRENSYHVESEAVGSQEVSSITAADFERIQDNTEKVSFSRKVLQRVNLFAKKSESTSQPNINNVTESDFLRAQGNVNKANSSWTKWLKNG